MQKPEAADVELNDLDVICIGKPDFSKLSKDKIDRHLKWCMESLLRYYGDEKGVTEESASIIT